MTEMIEGRNAVLEAFRSGKCVDKLFILDGCQDGPVRTIAREARKHDTIVKFANTNVDENSSREFAGGLYEELFKLSDVLGLKIEKKEEILDKEIEDLIQERQAARKAKDFKRADEIRDELLKKGIILKDTREGVKWQRA